MKLKPVTYCLAGVAAGAGITLTASAINNTAAAMAIVGSILIGGYALGRAHTSVEQQLPAQEDAAELPMIPGRSIPMDHDHGGDFYEDREDTAWKN